jgi:hypothetical protein
MQLVWKATTSVGWAKTSTEQVAMYCPKATTDTQSTFKANVGASCVDADKQNYNKCFNKVLRDASNAKRKLHGAAPLAEDNSTGGTLQGKLDDIDADDWPATTAPDLAAGTGCQDIFYKFEGGNGASDKAFMTTPLAVNEWYSFSKFYDFDKGTTIYPAAMKPEGKPKVD